MFACVDELKCFLTLFPLSFSITLVLLRNEECGEEQDIYYEARKCQTKFDFTLYIFLFLLLFLLFVCIFAYICTFYLLYTYVFNDWERQRPVGQVVPTYALFIVTKLLRQKLRHTNAALYIYIFFLLLYWPLEFDSPLITTSHTRTHTHNGNNTTTRSPGQKINKKEEYLFMCTIWYISWVQLPYVFLFGCFYLFC